MNLSRGWTITLVVLLGVAWLLSAIIGSVENDKDFTDWAAFGAANFSGAALAVVAFKGIE